MTFYIKNIYPNFIMGVYIHCRLVYLSTRLPALTEFEKGQIDRARIVRASVTKTAELIGFSTNTVLYHRTYLLN